MLRDQVQHLQKRIATLEDELEDTRATYEREEAAIHERIKRYKEREEVVRKELAEGKKQKCGAVVEEDDEVVEVVPKKKKAENEEAEKETTLVWEMTPGPREATGGPLWVIADGLSGVYLAFATVREDLLDAVEQVTISFNVGVHSAIVINPSRKSSRVSFQNKECRGCVRGVRRS